MPRSLCVWEGEHVYVYVYFDACVWIKFWGTKPHAFFSCADYPPLNCRYADEPSIMRYIKIAATLQDKSVRDVALRCRWMKVSLSGGPLHMRDNLSIGILHTDYSWSSISTNVGKRLIYIIEDCRFSLIVVTKIAMMLQAVCLLFYHRPSSLYLRDKFWSPFMSIMYFCCGILS